MPQALKTTLTDAEIAAGGNATRPPIRLDTYFASDLRTIGRRMAAEGSFDTPADYSANLLTELKANEQAIRQNYFAAAKAVKESTLITPAAEWLLDNHHLVEQNIRHVRRDLSPRYYRQLPVVSLADGRTTPRILALVWHYIARTDSDFHLETFNDYVEGFQELEYLTIGELWAAPAFLRAVLIENLRRLSDRVRVAREMRERANVFADRIAKLDEQQRLDAYLSEHVVWTRNDTFSAQLLYRLRNGPAGAGRALTWLEEHLEVRESDAEEVLVSEQNRQSSGNLTTGNIIRSLRRIDDVNWMRWFESVSRIDRLLRARSDFGALDPHSRNAMRTTVETLARRSTHSELEVGEAALAMAEAARAEGGDPGLSNVANYLIGEGQIALENRLQAPPPLRLRMTRAYRRTGWLGVLVPTLVLTLLLMGLANAFVDRVSWSTGVVVTLLVLFILPATEAATALLHAFSSALLRPSHLIGYELPNGPPAEGRTLVVIPCLLVNRDVVDELVRNLELHYLANPLGETYFALASDWTDAPQEETADDRDLLAYAHAQIERLAQRYPEHGRRFFLVHRKRLYNEAQRTWMGWERKRGKLHELNLLLRGDLDSTFLPMGTALPEGIRYVVTLDADTRLPRDAVSALVGKMIHPLNHPAHDPSTGRVVRGYGILQPRVTASLTTGAEASPFQRTFSVNRGFDPYVFTTSDFYQDLTGEGTFTGKGIYDVDAFERALNARIPENAVLSHDLLEGSYARCALATDVEFVEDFPTTYQVEVSRQHRWARGDWQLLPFIFRPGTGLTALARWKMLDNLRRSLLPIAWVAGSIAGWCLLMPGAAVVWQTILILSLFVAPTLDLFSRAMPLRSDVTFGSALRSFTMQTATATAEIALRITFMAHNAALMADAIARTLYRLNITGRRMLEWRTAQQVSASAETDIGAYYRLMMASPMIGALGFGLTMLVNPASGVIAGAFAIIWGLAPAIAALVSRTSETEDLLDIAPSDAAALRLVARRTWRYYDEFVTAEFNFLPPDNIQEDPEHRVAERTSPTNIGMYLLSTVAARDFGWISFQETLARIGETLATIEKMEKHNGHLFNWYDIRSLNTLHPRYVSSVDSGNLAGHLVAVAAALRKWAQAPAAFAMSDLNGIGDVSAAARASLRDVPDDRRNLRPLRQRIADRLDGFDKTLKRTLSEPQLAPVRSLSLSVIAKDIRDLVANLDAETGSRQSRELSYWADALSRACESSFEDAVADPTAVARDQSRLIDLSERARAIAFGMDFAFLLNTERRLLSIGYQFDRGQLDDSCYDLLASEARLTSLFAIAKGDVAKEHWFRLGRPVTSVGWQAALVSWSGSMFEYLMPPIVTYEREGGILNQSNRLAIRRQIAYGRDLGIPWGISESAFNARDRELNYQYQNFGVPSLGLKRDLSRNRVIAPYATVMASMFMPAEAVANLERLRAIGAEGAYGFYDAVDFTPTRVAKGQDCAVVRNFMAHHQGMCICAIANAVMNGRLREYFHSDPVIEAAELLLQERAPQEVVPVTKPDMGEMRPAGEAEEPGQRFVQVDDPNQTGRVTALLSNGHYSVMLSATGAGYSRWNGQAVTRFRPDPVLDHDGFFVFLRDTEHGHWWSATAEPRRMPGEQTGAVFSDHKAEFIKRFEELESKVEVIVASNADAEGRKVTLRNVGDTDRFIEVTSYGEWVLSTDDADRAHPQFSKMFVHTSLGPTGDVIYAVRNKRKPSDPDMVAAHLVVDSGQEARETEVDTDRRAFIGRGRDITDPLSMQPGQRLTGAHGFVMDPIFALRRTLRVPAGKVVTLCYWTICAPSREELERAVTRLRRPEAFGQEETLAWTRSQVQLRHLGSSTEESSHFQRFAGFLLYPDLRLGSAAESGLRPQSTLWALGISGDFPIFTLRINDDADISAVQEALRLQEYLRGRGVISDLVIINERAASYIQDLQHAITAMCDNAARRGLASGPGQHIFSLRKDGIDDATHRALLAASRVVLHARNGRLSEQLDRLERLANEQAVAVPAAHRDPELPRLRRLVSAPPAEFGDNLERWNGFGGFDPTSRDYIVRLRGGDATPHPWINVIARQGFGFHVSAEGAGFTWSVNSRDYQITPWTNDTVVNRPVEAFYVQDTATGRVFSPLACLALDAEHRFECRHSHGSSTFSSEADGLGMTLVQTLSSDAPVKLSSLTVTNRSGGERRLRLAAFADLVLGNDQARTAAFIRTGYQGGVDALTASNPYSMDFNNRTSFLAASEGLSSWTTSRAGFLGRHGSIRLPLALTSSDPLPGSGTGGGDPCLALACDMTLAPGETRSITFMLGDVGPDEDMGAILARLRGQSIDEHLRHQRQEWERFFGTLVVRTPDDSFDRMVNGWLLYQNLACRIRARAAFYQASGAFGFRDQLQDTAALLLHDPSLARAQIINAASRQFEKGDVLHWWLPASGAGVRTMISDDVVWLAYLTAHYIEVTGDREILAEQIPYLTGPELAEGQHDNFFRPQPDGPVESLYAHCCRALDLALERTGPNGMPLILGGDWNDGMNRVGEEGRGESVWLGWFLAAGLESFSAIAETQGERARATRWLDARRKLIASIEGFAWDGDHYLRGTYDDGTPLGANESLECQIDNIAQSWSVLSGAGRPERSERAMTAVLERLVDADHSLIRLFTPPFERTDKEPGYIKGYPPGVRENGGQYTHAATWVVCALAQLGRADEAKACFDRLNPVRHSADRASAEHYRTEPYSVAADIYGAGDKAGRGGWTWYTGSAGWLYRAGVEWILGIRRRGDRLHVRPALPSDWPGYHASVRIDDIVHEIDVRRDGNAVVVTIDGEVIGEDGYRLGRRAAA